MMRQGIRAARVAGAMLLLVGAPGSRIWAAQAPDPSSQQPEDLANVRVDQNLGAPVPLDLTFLDEEGTTIRLGDLISGERPVILTPVFYECPMLCTQILNGLVNGMNELEWSAGDEFDIITFSFNPEEKPALAEVKKRAYLTQYRRPNAAGGWRFLTGSAESIEALTDALGYRYQLLEDGTYAHVASIMFLTPDGRISLYMNDVMFEPKDLRLALVEASEGSIGSPMDTLLLFFCYRYDPDAGSYVPSAWRIMRVGGVLTLVGIVVGLIVLVRRGTRPDGSGPKQAMVGGMRS